jgi:uncharacterized Zn-finger protein
MAMYHAPSDLAVLANSAFLVSAMHTMPPYSIGLQRIPGYFATFPFVLQCASAHSTGSAHERQNTSVGAPTTNSPATCGVCGKDFRDQQRLERHKHTHTRVRPYQCVYCLRTFRDKSNLNRHVQVIHAGRSPVCTFCRVVCLDEHSLEEHVSTHVASVCNCVECGIAFEDKDALERHSLSHMPRTKPYKCDVCMKAFSEKNSLRRHAKLHTEGRPYRCRYCDRSFKDLSHVRSHYHYCKGIDDVQSVTTSGSAT